MKIFPSREGSRDATLVLFHKTEKRKLNKNRRNQVSIQKITTKEAIALTSLTESTSHDHTPNI